MVIDQYLILKNVYDKIQKLPKILKIDYPHVFKEMLPIISERY
jgi:hypothetical protein